MKDTTHIVALWYMKSGLDIDWRTRKEIAKKTGQPVDVTKRFWNGARYCGIADMLCEAGKFGRKTGKNDYHQCNFVL